MPEQLPLWFLLLSLLLPRICLVVAYFLNNLVIYKLTGWVPLAIGALVPRALVLILIFQDRGFSLWLLVHAIVMACAYVGASKSK